MAINKTIFELDAAGTLADTDLFAIWQSNNATGPTKKVLLSALKAAVSGSTAWVNLTGVPADNAAYVTSYNVLQAQITQLKAYAAQASRVLARGTGGGQATTVIPFPSGFNSTTSMIFLANKASAGAILSAGMQAVNLIPTVVATGWSVSSSCRNENGTITYPVFSFVIITTVTTASNYEPGGSGTAPEPPTPPGGELLP